MVKDRPWLEYYKDVPRSLTYPDITMYESVMESVDQVPDKIAWDFITDSYMVMSG